MSLTSRQLIFANYLLKQIGFNEEFLRDDVLTKLKELYVIKETKIRWIHRRSHGRQMSYTQEYVEENHNRVISILLQEVNLKKNKYKIKKNQTLTNDYYSATDLGKFLFCPASYSIQKTFIVDEVESAKIGIDFHEKNLLLQKGNIGDKIKDGYDDKVISKIKRSKLVFSGHNNEFLAFKNESEKFIGIPDYIFLDDNGDYFVVEEKFQFTSDPNYWNESSSDTISKSIDDLKNKYYPSHKIQIISYIRNIKEYPIKYGYLIYWHYNFRDSIPYIHHIGVNYFVLSPKDEEYYEKVKSELNSLKKNGEINFINKINPFKCVKCVVSKYCSHKTGQIDKVSLPYSLDDIKMYLVQYPDELKK